MKGFLERFTIGVIAPTAIAFITWLVGYLCARSIFVDGDEASNFAYFGFGCIIILGIIAILYGLKEVVAPFIIWLIFGDNDDERHYGDGMT